MPIDPRQAGPRIRFIHLQGEPVKPLSLWQKVVGVAVAAGVFLLALTFSVVLLAVLATVGIVVGGWFWWKTRALRKQMRDAMEAARREAEAQGSPGASTNGSVRRDPLIIEGEVIREVREPTGDHSPDSNRRD